MKYENFWTAARIAAAVVLGGWGRSGGGLPSRCGVTVRTEDEAGRIAAICGALFGAVVKVSQEAPGGAWLASAEWIA